MTVTVTGSAFLKADLSATNQHSVSVTVAAGEGLVVAAMGRYTFGAPSAILDVKWDIPGDNQTMTLARTQNFTGTIGKFGVYYLPATTSAKTSNVTVTFADSNNNVGLLMVRKVTGHDVAAMIRLADGFNDTNFTTSDGANDTFASVAGDLVLDFFGFVLDSAQGGTAAGQVNVTVQGNGPSIGSSTKAGAASVVMGWTTASATHIENAHVILSIAPAAAAADTTAPVLSSPTGAATGNTTASASVGVSEVGTVWCLTNTAATATVTETKAGTSKAVTAPGVQTFAERTGLLPDTLYYNHFVADDLASPVNTSTVSDSPSFRTPGKVVFSGPVPTRNGVVGAAASFANAGFFASAFTLTYTLQAGTLPAGLTLSSSTGIISGTPTTAGTSSGIVIRATDTNSNVADTNAYSIVIAATNAAPTFPGTIANISGTAGVAITPVNVSGQFSDTDALAYTASPGGTAWPSGLVVNSSTGIISGTVAAAAAPVGLKVRATDTASQAVDSNAFNVTITAAAAVDVTFPLSSPLENVFDGTPRVGLAVHAYVRTLAGAVVGTKTGLILNGASKLPAFTIAGYTTAGAHRITVVNDADPLDFAEYVSTAA